MNIYPIEIEAALRSDMRVKEVLAYGFDNQFGTQIGLKVVGDFDSVDEIKALCLKTLPSFQVPSVIQLVDELPKNGSGKIIRRS
jgi:long-chain acyl-CoA synthetase